MVRRALALAETAGAAAGDSVSVLRQLHASGQALTRDAAESYLAQVRAERHQWHSEP